MSVRLLMVDDNCEFRAILKSYLITQNLNLEIFEATSAEMAVTKASFVKPHIILMDINLPKLNGLAAAREILKDLPACHLIILTMFEIEAFKKAAKDVNAFDFIAKSDIYERLVPAIKKCPEFAKACI
ncbi:MAG: response regulator [Candidatus Omnitrophota bacterium]